MSGVRLKLGRFEKRVGDFPLKGRIITMVDRYQGRSFPGRNDYVRDDESHGSSQPESDPLAELARLIGQTDPYGAGTNGRTNLPPQPHAGSQARQTYWDDDEFSPEAEEGPPPGPPSWMQRAAYQEPQPLNPEQDYPAAVHPLHRYAETNPSPQSDYHSEPAYVDVDAGHEPDLSRYDEALYGSYDRNAQHHQHDQEDQHHQGYADDGYAYDEEPSRAPAPKRRGGMATVFAVLALAVFGVGGAFAYRTYSGSARTGEPPIIRADAGPTKVIPSPPDGATKVPDRMATGDGMEKVVSREETPLDPNARSVPRVVWPTPPSTGPSAASIAPASGSPTNGTMPNSEPHRIKTFAVRGEQADAGVSPAAQPQATAAAKSVPRPAAAAPVSPQRTASAANASANAPMSLSPQANAAPPAPAVAAETQTRVAAINPVQTAPSSGGATGGFLVQVSSQQSEADAEASYRALQSKYPSVLGSHTPLIKRANVGEKVVYRALIGPFGSSAEASQFCGNLKSAGGQCFIQRN